MKLFGAISDKVMHKAAFGGEREGGRGAVAVGSLTVWLCCDWVEPYIVIPLAGGANCGTSASTKPRLLMRLMREKPRTSLASANITQQHNNTTRSSHRPSCFNQEGRGRVDLAVGQQTTKERNGMKQTNKRSLSL